jgi:hypothetical protein
MLLPFYDQWPLANNELLDQFVGIAGWLYWSLDWGTLAANDPLMGNFCARAARAKTMGPG